MLTYFLKKAILDLLVRTANTGDGRQERATFSGTRSCAGVDLINGIRDNGRSCILLAKEGGAMANYTHGVVVATKPLFMWVS